MEAWRESIWDTGPRPSLSEMLCPDLGSLNGYRGSGWKLTPAGRRDPHQTKRVRGTMETRLCGHLGTHFPGPGLPVGLGRLGSWRGRVTVSQRDVQTQIKAMASPSLPAASPTCREQLCCFSPARNVSLKSSSFPFFLGGLTGRALMPLRF